MLDWMIRALVVFVPGYIGWRFKRAGRSAVFNILLCPLALSYFYLLLPSLITTDAPLAEVLRLSEESRDVVNGLSAWYVIVFLAAYMLSRDSDASLNRALHISRALRVASHAAQLASMLVLGSVLVLHGPELLAQSADRVSAYDYYTAEVLNAYRIPVVFAFAVAGCSVLYLDTGRKRHLVPLILFAVLDGLHGGRGYTVSALVAVYLNVTARNTFAYTKTTVAFTALAVAVFCSAFWRRHVVSAASSDAMIDFAGEFYYTRLTARYVYDYMKGPSDLLGYLGSSVARLLPQSLVGAFVDPRESLVSAINGEINAGFGLAGSVLSEALYYGGTVFAFVSPVLIVLLYWVAGRRRVITRLPGYILFVLMLSTAHVGFRTAFYPTFFSIQYTMFVYLGAFVILGWKQRVLVSACQQSESEGTRSTVSAIGQTCP